MKSTKEEEKQATEVSRKAKKALEEWRQEYIVKGMKSLMWDFDYEELEQIIKLLHLKLRNQQSAGVLVK